MGRLVPLLSLLVLAGCPAGDDAQDGNDDDIADAGVDGGGDVTGLVLTWESRLPIPGSVEDDLTVQSMRFGFTNLRLEGDAGTVPVERSELAWSAGVTPENDVIESAPAGVYSSLQAMLAAPSAMFAFEIQGTYNGAPYSLRDSAALPLAVDFGSGLHLVAGGGLVIDVRVDIDDVVDEVDFTMLPIENGTLVLGPGDPQLPRLRDSVADAFDVSED